LKSDKKIEFIDRFAHLEELEVLKYLPKFSILVRHNTHIDINLWTFYT